MAQPDLFFFMASYMPWDTSVVIPRQVFRILSSTLLPQRFDDHDPPRRRYTGSEEDVILWLKKRHPQQWGGFLHFERRGKNQPYYLIVDWVNLAVGMIQQRGDYNELYGLIKWADVGTAIRLWQGLCEVLRPFHAFLDTEFQYIRKAHRFLRNGLIDKTTGWYRKRLPGLFAYNFFGNVYVQKWGRRVLEALPPEWITFTPEGFYLYAPSGLDLQAPELISYNGRGYCFWSRPISVDPSWLQPYEYSPEDRAIIRLLGEEWFHLPDRPDRDCAPTLEEFRAATPPPPQEEE
jgi:hypothetical protein